jgi:hypothetical protein
MKRLRRSARDSRALLLGDGSVSQSLRQRWKAYRSLSVGMPWPERLALAAIGRDKYNARRKLEKAQAAAQAQLERELEQSRDL